MQRERGREREREREREKDKCIYIYIHTCTRMDIVCLQSFADPSYEAMVFLLGRIFLWIHVLLLKNR